MQTSSPRAPSQLPAPVRPGIAEASHVLATMASAMVEDRDALDMDVGEDASTKDTYLFRLRAAGADMPRLIGRGGRTVEAMRLLLFNVGAKRGLRFRLEVGPPRPPADL